MQTEIGAKWLNIDKEAMRQLLKANGAKLVHTERKMVRQVFDYPDKRLEKIGGWVRVRDEGDKITLSYKQLNDRTLHGSVETAYQAVYDVTEEEVDNWEEIRFTEPPEWLVVKKR